MYIHFVLTGKELKYPYYLAVKSALETQIDVTKVILWYVSEFSSPHISELLAYPKFEKRKIEQMPTINMSQNDDNYKMAHLKDYLQWYNLYNFGGMAADLDTLFLQDVTYLLPDNSYYEVVAPLDVEHVSAIKTPFHIGIILARAGSLMIKELIDRSASILQEAKIKWGDTGPALFSEVMLKNITKIRVSEYGELGGHKYLLNGMLYEGFESPYRNDVALSPNTKVMHLYAQQERTFDNITPEYISQSNSIYARQVRKMGKLHSNLVVTDQKVFHVLGLAHLPTNKKEACACAYSQKIIKMCKMLKSLGHKVYFYGVEGSEVECDEFIKVSTQDVLIKTYGEYDFKSQQYKHNPLDEAHRHFNANCIVEINKRKNLTDFLLISMGNYQKPISDNVKLRLTLESGIGYTGVFCEFKVFESYIWMHHVYGLMGQTQGHYYDAVVPNYFEPEDFEYRENKSDYFLYLGRLVHLKGIQIAKATVEAINAKLLVAGQPSEEKIDIQSPNIEYVGFADWDKRRGLLAGAKALFVPTIYIEPFGGVSIEAALSGTPVITTDWGVFPENVLHGVTGFRCRTLDQFVYAANNIDQIRPVDCFQWAKDNFSIDRIKFLYEEYFDMLSNILKNGGWYYIDTNRAEMNWLRKEYPNANKQS